MNATKKAKHLGTILLLLALSTGSAHAFDDRPNVLFIFADDQRPDTISALGNSHIITPNLDRLSREGIAFTRNYCMGSMSGAVCAPSRFMLLTGRSLWRIRGNVFGMKSGEVLMPEVFRKAGYATFGTGKWHNGKQWFHRCFSHGDSILFGGMGSHTDLMVHDFDPSGRYQKKGRRRIREFSSTEFATATVGFLENLREDQPFFAYVSFTAPHDPRTPPRKYRDLYDPASLPLPPNFAPRHPFNNGEMIIRDEKLAPWPRTADVTRRHLAEYYGMISQMDSQVGRILEALKKTGRYDNTVIVFAADHGLAVGSHGLLGKQNLYEHSMGCPLIVSGPGLPRGGRRDALTYLLDIFPTVCDLAGLETPNALEGHSVVPLIKKKVKSIRDNIYLAYRDVQRAIVTDRWKLIRYPRIGRNQLFDLKNDPAETQDLSGKPEHKRRMDTLMATLEKLQEKYGDPHPLVSDKPMPLQIALPPRKTPKRKGK